MTDRLDELRQAFAAGIAAGGSFSGPLRNLLAATGSRAVGLWRRDGRSLQALGFEGADDMPDEVRTGFAQGTARVPLDQTSLGIVKAALTERPAVATRTGGTTGLAGSAGWLERFDAAQSLAVPILRDGELSGVLAISTPYAFDERHGAWQLVVALAAELGAILNAPE
jgi:hypothetical protein